MKRIKRLVIILIAAMMVLSYAPGLAGIKASMTGIGVGARGSVFHGSFAGIANDYSANFWNPAGMAFINQFSFGAMLFRLPLDQDVSYLGVVYPVSDADRIGLGWTGCYIGNLQARTGNSANPDYLFSSSDQTIGLSYSRKIGRLGIGFSGKALYHSLDDAVGIGYSFDAGAMYRINDNVVLALVLYDINSRLHWQTGTDDLMEKIVNLAGSYQWQNLTMALALESNYLADQPEVRLSGGAEFRAMDLLAIRGGIYNNKVGFGFGLAFDYQNINITVNYAAISSRISDQLGHCFDVSFSWNKGGVHGASAHRDNGEPIVTTETKPKPEPKSNQDAIESVSKPDLLPGENRVVQITGDKVNVRKGPGIVYLVIGQAQKNQIFQLIDEFQGWYQINFDGMIGWIEGSLAVVR